MEDRVDDMVKKNGEKVFTFKIEQALKYHSSVADVAVVGVPDPKSGSRIVAFLVLRPGNEASEKTAEEIKRFCRNTIKMNSIEIPDDVRFVAEIPRTAVGKALKGELRKMLK